MTLLSFMASSLAHAPALAGRWLVRIRELVDVPRLGLAALGLGGLALAGWWVARPDLALVEHVAFEGAERATAAQLRHLIDHENGTTMWEVDPAALARGAERHPWVRTATARRQWPATVVVSVEEYAPVALLAADRLLYVAADGTPIVEADASDLDYPLITGLPAADTHPDLPAVVLRDALALVDALDARQLVARGSLSEVAFADTRGFTVHLTSGARVRFGLSDHARQLDRLAALRDRDVDLSRPLLVDLAPATLALVRPLEAR